MKIDARKGFAPEPVSEIVFSDTGVVSQTTTAGLLEIVSRGTRIVVAVEDARNLAAALQKAVELWGTPVKRGGGICA